VPLKYGLVRGVAFGGRGGVRWGLMYMSNLFLLLKIFLLW
jgi:hypothetical protein